MDIEVKFKLIDFLYLSPEELPYLTKINIPKDVAKDILKDKIEALYNYLESLQKTRNWMKHIDYLLLVLNEELLRFE